MWLTWWRDWWEADLGELGTAYEALSPLHVSAGADEYLRRMEV